MIIGRQYRIVETTGVRKTYFASPTRLISTYEPQVRAHSQLGFVKYWSSWTDLGSYEYMDEAEQAIAGHKASIASPSKQIVHDRGFYG